MISLEDCIAFCGLNEDEVAAISEHEHIPEIAAAALASYLLKQSHGSETIRTMIVDDIHKALDAGHVKHAAELFMALRHFPKRAPDRMNSGSTRKLPVSFPKIGLLVIWHRGHAFARRTHVCNFVRVHRRSCLRDRWNSLVRGQIARHSRAVLCRTK